MKRPHPAVDVALQEPKDVPFSERDRGAIGLEHTTSVSLARTLAIGCLSRLNPERTSVNIWDPAAGTGFAGSMLVAALRAVGIRTLYRGQDIHREAVLISRRRFADAADAEVAFGDTLVHDEFTGFDADLVIIDSPWGMDWSGSRSAVESRHASGDFGFGLPHQSDSTWLFISLALERLRTPADGGGRVAALVNPGALSSIKSAAVRRQIVEAGLLESVTRLPDGLAPNTSTPLYLVTFTNKSSDAGTPKVRIADMQTQFTGDRRRRSVPVSALRELESGMRTGKPGPRNRIIGVRQLVRRDARLSRVSSEGARLSWRLTTYTDTTIDDQLLGSRYGTGYEIQIDKVPDETFDLDPSPVFSDSTRDVVSGLEAKDWPTRRLSNLLAAVPQLASETSDDGQMFVPTAREGTVSIEPPDAQTRGRILSIRLDGDQVQPAFLAAWLNSEEGVASRRLAIEASSSRVVNALRPDPQSLMRWADELIIPVPERTVQIALASADERFRAFQAELDAHREGIWASPETAEEVVGRVIGVFDNSLSAWLEQLPFPVASALWVAETASTPGEQQGAYLRAWEAIVTFHATVLLSAIRSDPVRSREAEASICRTLQAQGLSIERATFGTWTVIIEKASKELRDMLYGGDADDAARVRHTFGDLSFTAVERLISKDLVRKFNELNRKRNRWLGHSGYTSDEEWRAQVDSLVSDLRDLRQLLGNVWQQLVLVRAQSAKRRRDGLVQTVEVALGTRSPFAHKEFRVGDMMQDGELYLVKDGSQSPLRLAHFVQLRTAPRSAQYTTYFYNRTEGSSVRMISFQHGPESELQDDVEGYREEFGALAAPIPRS